MTTTPHRTKVRSSIAVFHYTGTEWIIVRGIKGLGLRRAYGEHRLRNACLALDALPYDDNLRAISKWCHEDDNVPY
jgi:hypothetical protein